MKDLIFASSSPYKIQLLNRLSIPFKSVNHTFNERSLNKILEPEKLSLELAKNKALSLKEKNIAVLGADQIAAIDRQVLHKPGSRARAIEQLKLLNGKTHQLHTAVYLITDELEWSYLETIKLRMKELSSQQIINYVDRDKAWDCAGAYKIEEHGIALFDSIDYKDYHSIIGLPLMELSRKLTSLGYQPLSDSNISKQNKSCD